MDFPENTLLPIFAYGVFCPGEIAYLRLKPYLKKLERGCQCAGELLIRDGLTLLKPSANGSVDGDLLHFLPEKAGRAYFSIVELEPDKQYKWETIDVKTPSGSQKANVLVGVNLRNGCSLPDRPFVGREDPLFKESFQLIEEILSKYSDRNPSKGTHPDFRNLLYLQMAYMLLWSSIERYATLRYSLGDDVMAKILQITKDPFFVQILQSSVSRTDKLFPMNDPSADKALKLNKDNPRGSLKYYYQVRCNISHRGKAAFDDFDRLKNSLSEVSNIFKKTLENAFQESATEP